MPADHVVTKTFYLLDSFVGRYASGQTWIEALPPPIGDNQQRPARSGRQRLADRADLERPRRRLGRGRVWRGRFTRSCPATRGQHEMALRGGVNLVMYTLTGNYKADQVHVRDLLERLGH